MRTYALPKALMRRPQQAHLVCEACGKPAARRAPVQRYCEPCSEVKDRERKRVWAGGHPLSPERSKAKRTVERARTIAQGRELSVAAADDITWCAQPPTLAWLVRIKHPFDYGLSKNSIYRMGLKGHVTLRKEANALRESLALKLKRAMRDVRPVEGKVWIDIFVQKPNHKGDAVNVLDAVCDAIKGVIGVDDRWYSIRQLDWQIVKVDPQIFVGVGQEVTEPHRACASCGRVLPHTAFRGKKRLGRECKECLNVQRTESRELFDEFAAEPA